MEETPTINPKNIDTCNFNLISNNGNNFNIKISYNNFLLKIISNEENKDSKNIFQCISSIEEIKKTRYFLQFENIQEIYNELQFLIKQNENLVSLNEKDSYLELTFKLPNSKNEQIIFKLEKDNDFSLSNYFILKENLSQVLQEINQLKEKIVILEKDNFEFKKDNFELKKEIENIKNILIKENQLDGINNKIKDLNSLICNEEENKIIKNYINPNQLIKAELLYRLSRDGNSIQKFHELCDNKGATLVLYRTQNGMKLGGFSPLSWDSNTGEYKDDWDTFVFSLTRKEKYPKKSISYSIFCNALYGPYFNNFGISDNMEIFNISLNSTFQGLEKISDTKNSYDLNEVEIFKITIM